MLVVRRCALRNLPAPLECIQVEDYAPNCPIVVGRHIDEPRAVGWIVYRKQSLRCFLCGQQVHVATIVDL